MPGSIAFRNVSKQFDLSRGRSRSFQDLFLRLLGNKAAASEDSFWALRDVSFEVGPGETLGIVGENGAGKSTILKLVARILEPDAGQVQTDGRLASLLELGAGFHPDLTGRENVYLYGSILGLSRREMRTRFDQIVDFSEVHRFIDVPLKHYSSGMQVRLGFAVAASLDPDVLLVDEVLAVGDEVFQKKCLGRIAAFQRAGKTIVFVSHSLDLVRRLCTRALWLEDGCLVADGAPQEVAERYRARTWEREARRLEEEHTFEPLDAVPEMVKRSERGDAGNRWGTGEITIENVSLRGPKGEPTYLLRTGEPVTIEITYEQHAEVPSRVFGIAIHRADGLWCYGTNTEIEGVSVETLAPEGTLRIAFQHLSLLEGSYTLDVAVHHENGRAYDYHSPCLKFEVRSDSSEAGVFRPVHRWLVNDAPQDGAAADGQRSPEDPLEKHH
jgi:ABC-type polysaccharide/polyol phosphate transport system ATPase subunit